MPAKHEHTRLATGKDQTGSNKNKNRSSPLFYFGLVRLAQGSDTCSMDSVGRAVSSASETSKRWSGQSGTANLLNFRSAKPSAFSDVQLGQLIGRGAYGKVHVERSWCILTWRDQNKDR